MTDNPTPVTDCLCPCNVPVCPDCGHAWTHYMEFSDGQRTYTDAYCVARYEALYGGRPFKAVTDTPAATERRL